MNGRRTAADEPREKPPPFPNIDEIAAEKESVKAKKRSEGPGSHRRSLSGNLLSKFLRSSGEQDKSDGVESERSRGAMAEAQSQRRKRKGSLRKTVLGKGRDRKISDNNKSPLSSPATTPTAEEPPRPNREFSPRTSPGSPPRWPFRTLSRVSIPSIRSSIASVGPASSRASVTSPTMDGSTDEDDLVLPRMPTLRKLSSSASTTDSYFPDQEPVKRLFSGRTRSPLATQPQSVAGSPVEDEEWDYSETAFWGYVILIVTWLVFVVGMGSCFGVWSWAWDVGETPYAPPELEDDPTLPIVGYYPALLVLTCIMAWVWVVVAWVGMKYFRHADFKGEEG
jgi:Phosphatidylinositol N-acetylglucosaminyltransferase subunit Y